MDSPSEMPVVGPPSKQVASRLADARKAREMLSTATRRAAGRYALYAEIAEAYDRVPPDDQRSLQADGLGWSCNVNWGGMEQGIDSAVEPLFNLATSSETYVKLRTRHNSRNVGTQLAAIAREDKTMMDAWADADYEWELMLHFRKAYGLGIFYFRQPVGWHYSALNPANAIFPSNSALNPNKLPWFAVKTTFDIVDLIQKLGPDSDAAAQGWDLAEVRRLIENFRNNHGASFGAGMAGSPEAFINGLAANGVAYAQTGTTTVPGYILYLREWDGRVSEYLLPQEDSSGYLFAAQGRYSDMAQVVNLLPDSLGQGILDRVRGYGVKSLPFHDAEDRLLNQAFDSTFVSSSLMLQGGNPGDLMRAQEISLGPITYLPDNVNVIQQKLANPIQGLLAMQTEMQRIGASRSASFGGRSGVGREAEKTLGEARLQYQDSKSLETFSIHRFYRQLSAFHSNRFHRAFLDDRMNETAPGYDLAAAAVRAMSEAGVEKETLDGIYSVTAAKAFGDGNPGNQWLAMMDVGSFVGRMSEEGKRKYAQAALTARLQSPEMAEEFLGEPGADDHDRDQINEAQTETAVLLVSHGVIEAGATDNHLLHSSVHTVSGEEIARAWQEGAMPLGDALAALTRIHAHMETGHFAGLSSDPQAEAEWEDINRRWANLINTLRQMSQQQAAEQEQAQQEQLEQLRNPAPSVKDQEAAQTESLRRAQMVEEHGVKLEMLKRTAEADIMVKKATAQASLETARAAAEKSPTQP